MPSSDGDSTRHLENKSFTSLTSTIDDAGTEDGSCTFEPGRNGYPMSHVDDLEASPAGENAPPAPREQDVVVVLSDSDDDDTITVLSPKVLGVGGDQPGGGPNETTYLALKEGFDDLGLTFWDFPLSPQDVLNYQMFDSGSQVTDNPDGVENHPANDQSKREPVSVGDLGAMAVAANSVENVHDGLLQACTSSKRDGGSGPANLRDHSQTCHDLHSDNCDESLVTAKTTSKKRRTSKGAIAALDVSVCGSTAYEDQICPARPPEKQLSVRPSLVVID